MTKEREMHKKAMLKKHISNYRDRRKEAGLKEIRNLWIRPEDETRVRNYVRKITTVGGSKPNG